MNNDQNMINVIDQFNENITMYDGILGLIAILVSISIALLLFWQIRKQSKRESARLLWEFVRRLYEEDFRVANQCIKHNINRKREDIVLVPQSMRGSGKWDEIRYDVLIPRFLNHFSRMAVLNDMGVVDSEHILHMFRGYLKNIKDGTEVQLFIKERQLEQPEDFKPLQKLLEKI